jgi:hypothetical protein
MNYISEDELYNIIEHYAQRNDLLVSDNLIWFAKAIWEESIAFDARNNPTQTIRPEED